jgi:hypothetical protein
LSRFDTSGVSPGVLRIISDNIDGDFEDVAMAVGSAWSARGEVRAVGEDGTVWEAAENPSGGLRSLRSYDGETWTQYRGSPRASASGPDPRWPPDYLKGLAVHPDGSVWVIGAKHGDDAHTSVQHLGPEGWTVYSPGDGLPSLSCADECGEEWNVVITPDGTVWVMIDLGGLVRFDGTEWEVVRPLGDDEDHPIVSLAANRDGILWAEVDTQHAYDADTSRLGEGRHLARYDGQNWEVFSTGPPPGFLEGAESDHIGPQGIQAVGPDGTVWLTTISPDPVLPPQDYPVSFDGERWRLYPEVLEDWASDPLNDPEQDWVHRASLGISDITLDPDGSAWVSVRSGNEIVNHHGLYVITPEAVAATE